MSTLAVFILACLTSLRRHSASDDRPLATLSRFRAKIRPNRTQRRATWTTTSDSRPCSGHFSTTSCGYSSPTGRHALICRGLNSSIRNSFTIRPTVPGMRSTSWRRFRSLTPPARRQPPRCCWFHRNRGVGPGYAARLPLALLLLFSSRQVSLAVLPIVLYLKVGLKASASNTAWRNSGTWKWAGSNTCMWSLPGLDGVEYAKGDNWLGVALSVLMKIHRPGGVVGCGGACGG